VLTCSALEHAYRDVLRSSRARVRLVHLDGAARLVAGRRDRPGGHFMPAALLGSQLETLEPLRADEDGVVIDVTAGPHVLPGRALAALDLSGRTNRTELLCPR
jgi:gluconokinase